MDNKEQPSEMDAFVFAKKIKTWRKTHGLTQAQAAKVLDITYSSYPPYESCSRLPKAERKKHIMDVIKASKEQQPHIMDAIQAAVPSRNPPPEETVIFSQKLGKWQEKYKLSLREAGELLGISPSDFFKYRAGNSYPHQTKREKILEQMQKHEENPKELERRESIGKEAKQWREKHNLSIKQAGRIFDISSGVLSNYESGEYRPMLAHINKIEKIIYNPDVNIAKLKDEIAIGQRLKTWRKEKNLSQAQAAKILGIFASVLSRYEQEKKLPKNSTRKKMLAIIARYESRGTNLKPDEMD